MVSRANHGKTTCKPVGGPGYTCGSLFRTQSCIGSHKSQASLQPYLHRLPIPSSLMLQRSPKSTAYSVAGEDDYGELGSFAGHYCVWGLGSGRVELCV
ncbi:hypothetical protein LIER_42020 [Lithospermum erythrorhizon]|uniref:Uncharacterized protein n=1 Tax=Lithospermum erythrorhizon TaxID=34254 RepID=A0AAV3RLF3_LITER